MRWITDATHDVPSCRIMVSKPSDFALQGKTPPKLFALEV